MEPKLLRVEEAARLLSLGRSKTYELVAEGVLPAVRVGRAVRIPAEALDRWVARQAAEAEAAATPVDAPHTPFGQAERVEGTNPGAP